MFVVVHRLFTAPPTPCPFILLTCIMSNKMANLNLSVSALTNITQLKNYSIIHHSIENKHGI